MRYECIKDLCLEKYDDNGFSTNKSFWISKGTVWEKDESQYRMIGGSDTIHLDRVFKSKHAKTSQWIEILLETLSEHFSQLD